MSQEPKMGIFEVAVLPAVLYVCEAWAVDTRSRKRMDVLEIKGLRTVTGMR